MSGFTWTVYPRLSSEAMVATGVTDKPENARACIEMVLTQADSSAWGVLVGHHGTMEKCRRARGGGFLWGPLYEPEAVDDQAAEAPDTRGAALATSAGAQHGERLMDMAENYVPVHPGPAEAETVAALDARDVPGEPDVYSRRAHRGGEAPTVQGPVLPLGASLRKTAPINRENT